MEHHESTSDGLDSGLESASETVDLPEAKIHICQESNTDQIGARQRQKELRLLGLNRDDFVLFHSQPKAYKVLGVFNEENNIEQVC